MTFKQWTAVIQLTGVVLVALWLALDVAGGGANSGVAAVAARLLWAVGAVLAFNIVASMVVSIVVTIVRREALRDEAADERDRDVAARSMRNSGIAQSVAAVAGLFALAFGGDPALGAYGLFAAPFLGGGVDALSRLVYYRIG